MAVWAWGLLGGSIGGGVSALASKFGLDGLHAVGLDRLPGLGDVPSLTPKQMLYVFVAGIVSHTVMYMMKNPVPKLEFDDSQPPFPDVPGAITKPKENDQ